MRQYSPKPLLPAICLALASAGCSTSGPQMRQTPTTAQDDAPGRAMPHVMTPDGGSTIDPTGTQMFGAGGDPGAATFENRLVTNVLQHSFTTQGGDFDPDLDAAGQTVAFASTRNSPRPDIFMKTVDGYAITQLTSDPADDIRPRFSPCGTRVAFCSNRDGNWDIWIINRDGTGLTQLTRDPADEIAPTWSPDGSRVAFCTWGRQSNQWEIWEMCAAQPGVRRFLAFGMFPAWSPDGRHIAFQRARQRDSRWFSVWTVELVDGDVRHPTEVAFSDDMACVAPSWSPDGKLLAFCTVRTTSAGGAAELADVWAIEIGTGSRWKLTDGSAVAFNPVWASTGRVFFVSSRTGAENIWSVAVNGAGTAAPVAGHPAGHGSPHAQHNGPQGDPHAHAESPHPTVPAQPGTDHGTAPTRVLGHQVEKTTPTEKPSNDHESTTKPAESEHGAPKDPH